MEGASHLTQKQMGMILFHNFSSLLHADVHRYVRGEGICVIIVKPLSKAIEDGDPIRAIIRSITTNQVSISSSSFNLASYLFLFKDGKTPGLTFPGRNAQEALLRDAYLVWE
jgi:acyl transferase domain-containing protein